MANHKLPPLSIRLPLGHSEDDLNQAVARATHRPANQPAAYQITRKSIDARKKGEIFIQYTVETDFLKQPLAGILQQSRPFEQASLQDRPVVVGSGPAGLFAALQLAKAGLQPLVIERGQPIPNRQRAVNQFWATGELDPENNVQFGEGGAGTFSDGKLTTNIKDPRCRAVLEELVLAGAPGEILILQKPHVGTDLLCGVVTRIRETILSLGGAFRFGTRLDDLVTDLTADLTTDLMTDLSADLESDFTTRRKVVALITSSLQPDGSRQTEVIKASQVILAIGHSARDTVSMFHSHQAHMEPKSFSMGVRIEHLQSRIDQSQYGPQAGHPDLPVAEYKLAVHLPGGRSVYTFCMCPGGQVIASASEAGGLVTNGMSFQARDLVNANSALLVEVTPADFPDLDPLAGIKLQRQIEQAAFKLGGQTYRAPAQRVGDFLAGQASTEETALASAKSAAAFTKSPVPAESVQPSYQPGVTWTDLANCLPGFITESLREAIPLLDRKLHGFAHPDAVMTGVETRSSSPVRIVRDLTFQSNLGGVYPCGEGAGYAGGIMSAAVDGLRCAEAVITQYFPV